MPTNDLSDEAAPGSNLSIGSLIVLVASLLVGAVLGAAALAFSFQSIPTDVSRLGVLIRALGAEKSQPETVLFGNSTMMSGFDARGFTESSEDASLAWNCASTGQTLTEAVLLSQELPTSVERVIYTLQIRATSATQLIHPNKFNTLFMSGLRPTAETRGILDSLGNQALRDQLGMNEIQQIAASRWAVRQLIDGMSRRVLRSDLKLEKATTDLFHPQAYSKPIPTKITKSLIAGRNRRFAENEAQLAAETVELSLAMAEAGTRAGRETVFVFPPAHPDLVEPNREAMNRVIANFQNELGNVPNVQIINATDLLPEDVFIDDMHPTDPGAATLTQFLAHEIGKMGRAN